MATYTLNLLVALILCLLTSNSQDIGAVLWLSQACSVIGRNVTATCCHRLSNQPYSWCYPREDMCGSLVSRGLSRMQGAEWNDTTSCEMGSFIADQRAVMRCEGIRDRSNTATLEVTDGVPKEFTISDVNVTGTGYSGAMLKVAAKIQFTVPNNVCSPEEEPWDNKTQIFVVSSNFSFPLTSVYLDTISIYEVYEVSGNLPYDNLSMETNFTISVVMGNGHGTTRIQSGYIMNPYYKDIDGTRNNIEDTVEGKIAGGIAGVIAVMLIIAAVLCAVIGAPFCRWYRTRNQSSAQLSDVHMLYNYVRAVNQSTKTPLAGGEVESAGLSTPPNTRAFGEEAVKERNEEEDKGEKEEEQKEEGEEVKGEEEDPSMEVGPWMPSAGEIVVFNNLNVDTPTLLPSGAVQSVAMKETQHTAVTGQRAKCTPEPVTELTTNTGNKLLSAVNDRKEIATGSLAATVKEEEEESDHKLEDGSSTVTYTTNEMAPTTSSSKPVGSILTALLNDSKYDKADVAKHIEYK